MLWNAYCIYKIQMRTNICCFLNILTDWLTGSWRNQTFFSRDSRKPVLLYLFTNSLEARLQRIGNWNWVFWDRKKSLEVWRELSCRNQRTSTHFSSRNLPSCPVYVYENENNLLLLNYAYEMHYYTLHTRQGKRRYHHLSCLCHHRNSASLNLKLDVHVHVSHRPSYSIERVRLIMDLSQLEIWRSTDKP